jgi:ABC-2 type transport system permease protein
VSSVSASLVPSGQVLVPTPASMIGTMMAHEWRLLRADRILRVVLSLFAVLLVAALINGIGWQRFQVATLAELRTADAQRFASYVDTVRSMPPDAKIASPFAPDPRNPMTIGSRGGTLAALDPMPLGVLAVGQGDLLPYYFRVNTGGRQAVLKGDEIENPSNLLTGRFDLAFVIVVLFPLVILALSYNMLSGEREDGTLALVLSQPVHLRTLLLAKIGVRAMVVLALAFVLVAAGLVAAQVNLGDSSVLVRAAWWLVLVAAYAAFWFGVAVVVNAAVRGSAASAVASVSVWLVLVVLAPVLVNLVAQSRYPTPSRVAFISTVRSVTNEANAVADRLMSKYMVDHPELAGAGVDMSDFWTRSLTVQDTVEKTLAPFYADFEQRLAAQQAVITDARVLTPALLMQTALEDLAGTGLPRWQAFRQQVLAFHQRWQDYFIPRQVRQQKLSVADVQQVPTFAFVEEGARDVKTRAITAMGWLLLPAALLWVVGLARLRRYSVVA